MAIYNQIQIAGREVTCDSLRVRKSTSDNNSASTFTAIINNYAGSYATEFTLGDEVNIYADIGSNLPTTKIFTGILENVNYQGKENREGLTLTGKDYTSRLLDRTIEPEVYNNLLAGSIVEDIMLKYTDDVSYSGVQPTTTTVPRVVFNQKPVYDGIANLAKLSNSIFYVDNDKDLHFEEKSTVSSNLTFNNTNVLTSKFKEKRDTVYNEVWVYGDRYLDGALESFTATGSTSEYTLLYKPHNTKVTVNAVIQKGGIADMVTTPTSGTDYLVDYEDRTITFQSGTDIGYDATPAAGSTVLIDYKRSLPIVKVGKDNSSIAQYKKRIKVIVDKDIKDPQMAESILVAELADTSMPKKEGNLNIKGVVDVTPSQTCVVDIPFHNINNQTYDIVEATYNFTKANNQAEKVLTVKVNKQIGDVTDTLKQMMLDIKKMQGADISDSDVLTRFEFETGSLGVRQSGCKISQRSIAGDTMIWGNSIFGIWGTSKWGDTATQSFILGHANAGVLGTSQLGDNSSSWSVVWSGCYP